jgi:photosystem II stability/assembly factor-like uncharacterized protein
VVGQWTSGISGNGIVIHTRDAETTLETQLQSTTFEDEYNRLVVLNATFVWVTAVGGLFHTSNGDNNWTEFPLVEDMKSDLGIPKLT